MKKKDKAALIKIIIGGLVLVGLYFGYQAMSGGGSPFSMAGEEKEKKPVLYYDFESVRTVQPTRQFTYRRSRGARARAIPMASHREVPDVSGYKGVNNGKIIEKVTMVEPGLTPGGTGGPGKAAEFDAISGQRVLRTSRSPGYRGGYAQQNTPPGSSIVPNDQPGLKRIFGKNEVTVCSWLKLPEKAKGKTQTYNELWGSDIFSLLHKPKTKSKVNKNLVQFFGNQGPWDDQKDKRGRQVRGVKSPTLAKANLSPGEIITIENIKGNWSERIHPNGCNPKYSYCRNLELSCEEKTIGTFTDDKKNKIGDYVPLVKFKEGVKAPKGATRLYVSVKDSAYFDNSGNRRTYPRKYAKPCSLTIKAPEGESSKDENSTLLQFWVKGKGKQGYDVSEGLVQKDENTHICAVYSAHKKEQILYINGQAKPKGKKNITGLAKSSYNFILGGDSRPQYKYKRAYDGMLDDFMIFDQALSAYEVTKLYLGSESGMRPEGESGIDENVCKDWARQVINRLNQYTKQTRSKEIEKCDPTLLSLSKEKINGQSVNYDTNRDGWFTPQDALMVINTLNNNNISQGDKNTACRKMRDDMRSPCVKVACSTPPVITNPPGAHSNVERALKITDEGFTPSTLVTGENLIASIKATPNEQGGAPYVSKMSFIFNALNMKLGPRVEVRVDGVNQDLEVDEIVSGYDGLSKFNTLLMGVPDKLVGEIYSVRIKFKKPLKITDEPIINIYADVTEAPSSPTIGFLNVGLEFKAFEWASCTKDGQFEYLDSDENNILINPYAWYRAVNACKKEGLITRGWRFLFGRYMETEETDSCQSDKIFSYSCLEELVSSLKSKDCSNCRKEGEELVCGLPPAGISVAKIDNYSTRSRLVTPGEQTLSTWDVSSLNGQALAVNELKVGVTTCNNSNSCAKSTTELKEEVRELGLYIGDTLIDKKVPFAIGSEAGTVTFKNSKGLFSIPKNRTTAITVKALLNAPNGQLGGPKSENIVAYLASTDKSRIGSGSQKLGNVAYLVKSYPTVTVSSPSSSTLTAGEVETIKVTVAADSAGDITFKKIVINAVSLVASIDGAAIRMGGMDISTFTSINGVAASKDGADITIEFSREQRITAGTSKTYSVLLNVTAVGSGSDSLVTKLKGDVPRAQATGTYAAISSDNSFVWSDMAGSKGYIHTESTEDHLNGKWVETLPSGAKGLYKS